jgi:hypothetical protein
MIYHGRRKKEQGTDQQQEEHEVDPRLEGHRDEDNQATRVSPEPGCSSKATQQNKNKTTP